MIFIVLLALSEALSYEEALESLSSRELNSINMTQILETLEVSHAYSKLGELFLLGMPNSSPPIRRNTTRALSFFSKSDDGDALFYLLFLTEQSKLMPFLDEFPHVNHYSKSKFYESDLLTSLEIARYIECMESLKTPLPSFMGNFSRDFEPACGGDCDRIARKGAFYAKKTLEHIQKQGYIRPVPPRIHENTEKNSESHLRLLQKAIKNNPRSALYMAESFIFSDLVFFVENAIDKSLHYYHLAAKQGSKEAVESLGIIYAFGIGTAQDIEKATHYLTQANSSNAFNCLAYMHFYGIGFTSSAERAIEYLQMAGDSAGALYNLGVIYMENREYPSAMYAFELSISQGYIPAYYSMGVILMEKLLGKQDCRKALQYFKAVIERGRITEFIWRGYLYFMEKDYQGAALNYAVASVLGSETAQLSLIYLWEKGFYPCKLKTYYCASLVLWNIAYANQNTDAFAKIGNLLYKEKMYTEAYDFYKKAGVNPEAMFSLAFMQQRGLGVEKNVKSAKRMYSDIVKYAEKGDFESESQYPARIALYYLNLRKDLSSYPIAIEILDYLFENNFS